MLAAPLFARRWPLGLIVLVAVACAPAPAPTPARQASPPPPPPLLLTPAPQVVGDPNAGQRLFVARGCGGCHTVRGVPGATGVAGPQLTNVALRPTLAGQDIPNTPENMVRWIMDPPAMKPGTAMPNLGITEADARAITAFLYSQPYNPAAQMLAGQS